MSNLHTGPMSSSDQARADAFADAETLRTYLREYVSPSVYLVAAGVPIGAESARGFARAAFRAVPTLRGEE